LVAAAATAIAGIIGDEADLSPVLSEDVDALVASGDLVPGRDPTSGRPVVYLSPPMFVRRSQEAVFLVGGFSESAWPLVEDVLVRGAYRQLKTEKADEDLIALG